MRSGLALVLDMDGVVVHSTPLHNEAWRLYLARHGIAADTAAIETVMLGKHNHQIVRAFLGDGLDEATLARHGREKEKLYRELMRPRLAEFLVPGVTQFLQRYHDSPIGIASNAEAANVSFVLDGAGLRGYFQAVIHADRVNRPKPDPEIYLKMASALGVCPANCIVFEDSDTGVRAALSAGTRVVGVATTNRRLEGAEITIENFLDPRLEGWLERLAPV